MKLGIVITGLGTGGAERHLLKVLPEVSHEKFVVSLTSLDTIGKELEKKGVRVYYLKGCLCKKILQFRKIIVNEKPDVLDTYLIHANIFGRIFGRMFGVKKIVNSVRNDYSDLKVLNFLDRLTKGKVDLFVPNSSALINYLKRNGVSSDKIKVLPNCVETFSGKNIREKLGLSSEDKVIVSTSRFHEQKKIDSLVEAASKMPGYKFLLVGDGKSREELEEKASSNVIFLGERKDIVDVLASSDVFVLPSRKEGMSNSLLEAMSAGLVCVVSDIPQNRAVLGEMGLYFPVGDSRRLADMIKKAFSKKRLGEKARKHVLEEHSIPSVVSKYEDIIGEVMSK
ncbi:MAG: glycosyltransferase [Nanobdellota archaeon]